LKFIHVKVQTDFLIMHQQDQSIVTELKDCHSA